jgi:hypothetical protein
MCNAVYGLYVGLRVKLSRMKIWSRSGSNQSGQLLAWSAWWAGTPAACRLARVGHAHIRACTPSFLYIHSHSGSHVLSQTAMHCLVEPCFIHKTVHAHATMQYMLYSTIVENHSHSHAQPYSYIHSLICVHALSLTLPCPFSNSHVLPCYTHTTVHAHATIVKNHSHSRVHPLTPWSRETHPCYF